MCTCVAITSWESQKEKKTLQTTKNKFKLLQCVFKGGLNRSHLLGLNRERKDIFDIYNEYKSQDLYPYFQPKLYEYQANLIFA